MNNEFVRITLHGQIEGCSLEGYGTNVFDEFMRINEIYGTSNSFVEDNCTSGLEFEGALGDELITHQDIPFETCCSPQEVFGPPSRQESWESFHSRSTNSSQIWTLGTSNVGLDECSSEPGADPTSDCSDLEEHAFRTGSSSPYAYSNLVDQDRSEHYRIFIGPLGELNNFWFSAIYESLSPYEPDETLIAVCKCGKACTKKYAGTNLRRHIREKSTPKIQCDHCEHSSARHENMLKHCSEMQHPTVTCPKCGQVFARQDDLDKHMEERHRQRG